jgi:hypothetical protein
MQTLESKYNFKASISDNVYDAFYEVSASKGLPVNVYLQTITRSTTLVANSTNPSLKDSKKVWVEFGDYCIHMGLLDYAKVNAAALRYHGVTLGEYLRPRVTYW